MKFIKMIGALFFCSFLNQAFSADKIEMNEYMVQSDTVIPPFLTKHKSRSWYCKC